jgi:hypothetical protein
MLFRLLSSSTKGIGSRSLKVSNMHERNECPSRIPYLRKVHTECIHVQSIEKASKALAEAGKTLMHQLKVHEICLEVCH